jgi:hypothetical protein
MNQILLVFLVSTSSIIILEIIRRISKSACSRVRLCGGVIEIERDIHAETSQKRFEIKNNYESAKTELPINIV